MHMHIQRSLLSPAGAHEPALTVIMSHWICHTRAGALKFIAQPAVQQLIDHIWFGQIFEQANTVPTMITAFFFPPAVVGLSFAAPGDRDEKIKEQPLLHASVCLLP